MKNSCSVKGQLLCFLQKINFESGFASVVRGRLQKYRLESQKQNGKGAQLAGLSKCGNGRP